MTLPYPSFLGHLPVDAAANRAALSAVGRCRIHPRLHDPTAYRNVVSLTTLQADTPQDTEETKALRKKYAKQSEAAAKKLLRETLQLDVSIISVEVVLDTTDVIRTDGCLACCFLDAGCDMIVLEIADHDAQESLDAAKIPKERLMAHVASINHVGDIAVAVADLCASWSTEISASTTEDDLRTLLANIPKGLHLSIHIPTQKFDEMQLMAFVAMVCAGTEKHHTVALMDPTAGQLGKAYASCIRSDRPDGLFATVVCSRSGEALGLVYSNTESIVAALECGRGVYYSRSRNGLWRKGDSSGHIQQLHRMDIDCDGDAVRFLVTQKAGSSENPAFCHLLTYTCWGPPVGLRHLEETLSDRVRMAPEGSYTKRLLDDPTLLRDKLVEEAQELSEAVERDHVVGELADVLFFAMTAAAKAGVSMDDAVAELARRSRRVTRRKGDSKAYRIAAGQAILDRQQKHDE